MKATLFAGALAAAIGLAGTAQAFEITDIIGRKVELGEPADAVVLGEGRLLNAVALLDREDPLEHVVGMLDDFAQTDAQGHAKFLAAYPRLAEIKTFGAAGADSTSAETIITLAPDAAIFGIDGAHGPSPENAELVAQLEAAGIQVVFVDFRADPLANTRRSVEILGQVLGREEEAAAYVEFYTAHIDAVLERVKDVTDRPKVFVQAHVGRMDCCVGMADGMLGPFVGAVGGTNISAEITDGAVGRHTVEFLLAGQPDILIGTASGAPAEAEAFPTRLILGAATDEATAQASLQRAAADPTYTALEAVAGKRFHAIWHNFYSSPLNIVALEAFAKWIHPELFADLDPAATLAEIHKRFLGLPMSGTFLASL